MNNYLANTTEEIYRWFHILNKKYFDDELPEPIITIQKTRSNTLGYFTLDKVWYPQTADGATPDEEDCKYEICISAQCLEIGPARTAEDICAVLLHELVHYSNKVNGVKDCSGKIHNKKFKAAAEKVGLEVERDKKVGWGYTSPSRELRDYITKEIAPKASALNYYRIIPEKTTGNGPVNKPTKYVCPKCGAKVQGKADFELVCKRCGVDMEIQ